MLKNIKQILRFLLPHPEMTYRYKLYRIYENIRYRFKKRLDDDYTLSTQEIINRNRGDWTIDLDESRIKKQYLILDKYYRFITEELTDKYNIKSILDVGCREGYLLEKLAGNSIDSVKGFEIVPDWVDFCHKKGRTFVENVNAMEVNIENYPKFDLIFSRHTLEHVDRPKEFFRKLVEFGHGGSLIFIVFPLNESPNFKHPSKLPSLDYISREFDFKGLKEIYFGSLKNFKFKEIEIDLIDPREDEEVLMLFKKNSNPIN